MTREPGRASRSKRTRRLFYKQTIKVNYGEDFRVPVGHFTHRHARLLPTIGAANGGKELVKDLLGCGGAAV